VAARAMFGIPFVGSLALILGGVLLFVLALVILGYLISTVSRTQMQAMQITFFFFLPSLMLSGFMFPYRGMPGWAQTLGEIFPLTHFLRLIRSVMLKGADAATVADSLAVLTLFVLVFSLVALLRFRRTLD
ncbi:MAG TPA: ABC transporter permease, partial [Pararhodobacter sp.]|uniref:ABC transporter permease n=1 Tax=Pararhodobacter sp. TaxID=2127056 RepID=UPI002C1E6AE2